MNTPQDVMNRAADMIEERGWWNGAGNIPVDGPLCLMMGVGLALVEYGSVPAVVERMRERVNQALRIRIDDLGYGGIGGMGWNDAPGRTQAEVTDLLRGKALTPVC